MALRAVHHGSGDEQSVHGRGRGTDAGRGHCEGLGFATGPRVELGEQWTKAATARGRVGPPWRHMQ